MDRLATSHLARYGRLQSGTKGNRRQVNETLGQAQTVGGGLAINYSLEKSGDTGESNAARTGSGAALRAVQEFDDGAPLLGIVEALNHSCAAHHGSRIREVGFQRLGRPGDAGVAQGGRVVEAFDAGGGAADDALQVRSGTVPGGRDLVAGPAALPEQALS
jgi:hypothetical protein